VTKARRLAVGQRKAAGSADAACQENFNRSAEFQDTSSRRSADGRPTVAMTRLAVGGDILVMGGGFSKSLLHGVCSCFDALRDER